MMQHQVSVNRQELEDMIKENQVANYVFKFIYNIDIP